MINRGLIYIWVENAWEMIWLEVHRSASDHNWCNDQAESKYQEKYESQVVVAAYAVVHPCAMMVETLDALLADVAVFWLWHNNMFTVRT